MAELPTPAELEYYVSKGWFEQAEADEIEKFRPALNGLSPEEKLVIGRRWLRAMWPDELDYIAHTCWITTKRGTREPLRPNYAQRRFYEEVVLKSREEARPIRGIILKARQLGFSTFIQALYYVWCEQNEFRNSLTVSYDDDSTVELFQKAHFIHENHWFPLPTKRMKGTTIQFSMPIGSTFYTKTAGSANVGRSFTIHQCHLSEMPMWDDPDSVLTGLKQSVPMTPDSCQLVESTAKGRVGAFYEMWQAAVEGRNDYIAFFAPWHWDPEYSLPFANSEQRRAFMKSMPAEDQRYMKRHEISAEQMNWRRWKIRNDMDGSLRRFQQEMPADADEAFLTTGNPVFNPEAVKDLAHGCEKPFWQGEIFLVNSGGERKPHIEHIPNGKMQVWEDPKRRSRYVVGGDVAENRQRDRSRHIRKQVVVYTDDRPDYSAAKVLEMESGNHVASWHGWIDPDEFALVLAAIGFYYNNALLVPEVNAAGVGVIDSLVKVIRYPNIYRSKQWGVETDDPMTPVYGWRTGPHSRPLLIQRIHEVLNAGMAGTRDIALVNELRTMEFDEGGVARARGRNKDDRVLAWALGLQGRYESLHGRLGEAPDDAVADDLSDFDKMVWKRARDRWKKQARQKHGVGIGGFRPGVPTRRGGGPLGSGGVKRRLGQ